MAIDTSYITDRIAAVQTKLTPTPAVEDVTVYEGNGTTERGEVAVVRSSRLSREALSETGWQKEYKFTIDILTSSAVGVAIVEGDVILMADGETRHRVLAVDPGPGDVYRAIHVGGEWE